MPKREVPRSKTRKALRKLQRAAELATEEGAPGLTAWERDFVEGVTRRLETYGSAFRDPGKGRLEEALSQRQAHVTRAIGAKSRKAKKAAEAASKPEDSTSGADARPAFGGSSLKRKSPMRSRGAASTGRRVRDINADMDAPAEPAPSAPPTPAEKRAALRVIEGGKPPNRRS